MAAYLAAHKPATTYLVHGEPTASSLLRDAVTKELGWNVQVAGVDAESHSVIAEVE